MTQRNKDVIARMRSLSCCILIPTYNNATTLNDVLHDALNFSSEVIVVNDGSTDNTTDILVHIHGIDVIRIDRNKGKGNALKEGFRYAFNKGFSYAVTVDSDGQHSFSDIPGFLDKIEECPHSMIIGARNMTVENKPKKNSFANKFSNFWYRIETGHKLPDTQSGFRLYPLEPVSKMKFFTRRYDFEIEVMVRCNWKGIRVDSVPIDVYYAPKEERISHFRPFVDFTRISILNTVLILIALAWVRPVRFIRSFSHNK
jgi:glycosyltransferase involved in cell wall biosynthesis